MPGAAIVPSSGTAIRGWRCRPKTYRSPRLAAPECCWSTTTSRSPRPSPGAPRVKRASRTVIDVEKLRPGTEDLLQHIDVIIADERFPSELTGLPDLGAALREMARRFDPAQPAPPSGRRAACRWSTARKSARRRSRFTSRTPPGPGTPSGQDSLPAGSCRSRPQRPRVLRYAHGVAALNCRGLGARERCLGRRRSTNSSDEGDSTRNPVLSPRSVVRSPWSGARSCRVAGATGQGTATSRRAAFDPAASSGSAKFRTTRTTDSSRLRIVRCNPRAPGLSNILDRAMSADALSLDRESRGRDQGNRPFPHRRLASSLSAGMTSMDDARLVEQCLAGDSAAFDELVERHRRRCTRCATASSAIMRTPAISRRTHSCGRNAGCADSGASRGSAPGCTGWRSTSASIASRSSAPATEPLERASTRNAAARAADRDVLRRRTAARCAPRLPDCREAAGHAHPAHVSRAASRPDRRRSSAARSARSRPTSFTRSRT